jgi:hypothetical protein
VPPLVQVGLIPKPVVAAAALIMSSACGGSAGVPDETVLRVSAPFGLSSLSDLNQEISGSSANAVELLLDPVTKHADVVRREGTRILLRPRAGGPSSTELASAFRSPGVRTTVVDPAGDLWVEFDTDAHAELATLPSVAGFALGPFELEDENLQEGWMRLRSRTSAPIDVIEIVAVDATEQWRRLHARDVDVVPASPSGSKDAYAGMTSVRTIDYPVGGSIGLVFNPRRTTLANPATRREIAAVIDASAAAAIACGDPACAAPAFPRHQRSTVNLPAALQLMVLVSDSVAVDVARVIRLQLEAAGIEIDLARVDIETLSGRIRNGSFDLMIGPFPRGPAVFPLVQSNSPMNFIGWSSDEFDTAVAHGDKEAAMRILASEVPLLPLVDDRQFAAVDSRFCGGNPVDVSWRWLADVYPCDQGASP